MPTKEEIEKIIDLLDHEFFDAYSVFKTYSNLFCSGVDTLDLLKESDAAFFRELYVVYLNYLSVAVSRLLDPARTGRKMNLTYFHLLDLLEEHTSTPQTQLRDDLAKCKEDAYNFTEPRNQLVAHLDLSVNTKSESGKSVPSFQPVEFNAFYESISKFMNEIRKILGKDPFMYEWGISGHVHGKKLLHRLARAESAIKNRIEQDEGGKASLATS